jgi:hypothetical protein
MVLGVPWGGCDNTTRNTGDNPQVINSISEVVLIYRLLLYTVLCILQCIYCILQYIYYYSTTMYYVFSTMFSSLLLYSFVFIGRISIKYKSSRSIGYLEIVGSL